MKWANQHGITRVHSAGQDSKRSIFSTKCAIAATLTVRMYIAYFLNPPELRHEDLDAIEHAAKKFHDDWIDAGAVNSWWMASSSRTPRRCSSHTATIPP